MIILKGIRKNTSISTSQMIFSDETGKTITLNVPTKLAEIFECGLAPFSVNNPLVERANEEDSD